MPQPPRTPDEIRASIEHNREQLGVSLEKLRAGVVELTDWRARARQHQRELSLAAAAAGFVVGGGIAGVGALLFGGGRRRGRRGVRY
jgi:hypothetical protein